MLTKTRIINPDFIRISVCTLILFIGNLISFIQFQGILQYLISFFTSQFSDEYK